MPQGYTENPIYFSHILKVDLDHLVFPHKSILIHYVDDLLLYSNSKGHKVSKEKLKFYKANVKYLGHMIFKKDFKLISVCMC